MCRVDSCSRAASSVSRWGAPWRLPTRSHSRLPSRVKIFRSSGWNTMAIPMTRPGTSRLRIHVRVSSRKMSATAQMATMTAVPFSSCTARVCTRIR